MLMVYAGAVWAADALEMMLLSFIGPAVRPAPGAWAGRQAPSRQCHLTAS